MNSSKLKIGRALYFLLIFLSGGVATLGDKTGNLLVLFLGCIVGLISIIFRNRDIGFPWWRALFSFVPILNLYYGYELLSKPGDFVLHRRRDAPMIVILILYWIVLLSGFIGMAIPAFNRVSSRQRERTSSAPPAVKPVADEPKSKSSYLVSNEKTADGGALLTFDDGTKNKLSKAQVDYFSEVQNSYSRAEAYYPELAEGGAHYTAFQAFIEKRSRDPDSATSRADFPEKLADEYARIIGLRKK
jgi:hypothetical protein